MYQRRFDVAQRYGMIQPAVKVSVITGLNLLYVIHVIHASYGA